jgi:hypothetical protein
MVMDVKEMQAMVEEVAEEIYLKTFARNNQRRMEAGVKPRALVPFQELEEHEQTNWIEMSMDSFMSFASRLEKLPHE